MMGKYGRIKIKKLNQNIYLFDDAGQSTGYLVTGNKLALVIDTMNGVENVNELVRSITDLPVMVVNTHGHCDHIYGNIYFKKAYIHKDDMEIVKEHTAFPDFIRLCREKGRSMPEFEYVNDGDVIDLGDLHVEIYVISGHTPGGLFLLLREDRVLFTGDSINHHVWMQLPESLDMKGFTENLEKLWFLTEKADYICYGHATDFDSIELYKQVYRGAKEIAEGKTAEDKAYSWFGGENMQHEFAPGSVICYK